MGGVGDDQKEKELGTRPRAGLIRRRLVGEGEWGGKKRGNVPGKNHKRVMKRRERSKRQVEEKENRSD